MIIYKFPQVHRFKKESWFIGSNSDYKILIGFGIAYLGVKKCQKHT